MKHTHISTLILLLSSTLLLGGCTEQRVSNTTHDNSSSDISDSNSRQDESISNSISGTESSVSSVESSISEVENSYDIPDGVELVPVEYTDEDRELQKILYDLKEPTEWIFSSIASPICGTEIKRYKFPELGSDVTMPFGNSGDYFFEEEPATIAGAKKAMLRYFSERKTENYMRSFAVCSVTEDTDGTYIVKFEDGAEQFITAPGEYLRPRYLEIDGQLYGFDGIKITSISIDYETAKIVSKTDDTIEFTYLEEPYWADLPHPEYRNEPLYSQHANRGILKYERGGWKLDDWNLPNS